MTKAQKKRKQQRSRLGIYLFCALAVTILLMALLPDRAKAGKAGTAAETMQETVPETETETETADSWLTVQMDAANQTKGDLVLVNAQNLWSDDIQQELVKLSEKKTTRYVLSSNAVQAAPQLVEPLNQMIEGFYQATGLHDINVVSVYRSVAAQKTVYQESVRDYGAEHTALYVAAPGASEHHTGLAMDLELYSSGKSRDFTGEGEYAWFYAHCADYGFIQRFPPDKQSITGIAEEEWHFRYVGKPHAALITERNLCLEEYIELLHSYPWDGEHLTADGYEIYFCPGDTIHVPDGAQYTVSGINGDGYVVTLQVR